MENKFGSLRIRTNDECWLHENETSGSIKFREFYYLRDCDLKKDSASLSYSPEQLKGFLKVTFEYSVLMPLILLPNPTVVLQPQQCQESSQHEG
jgi:hypothetical protein